MNGKPQKRTQIPEMERKSIVGVFRKLICPTTAKLPPSPYLLGGGGVTVKNKGDQEFKNLVSAICLNVDSAILDTF